MNVLSTFNGMGCIWLALDRLGIHVEKRYSCEIDKYANIVNDANYPDTIQLGDVTKVKGSDLEDVGLLVGGSPCQGFSFAGKQLNFEDPRSKLFFEFVRLREESRAKYFLLENVKMKKEYQDVISKYLGVEPVFINSNNFTAASRQRLYWTNIPFTPIRGYNKPPLKNFIDFENIDLYLDDITEKINKKRKGTLAYTKAWGSIRSINEQAKCLTAGGQGISNSGATNISFNDKFYRPKPNLCEAIQGVPDNYTNHVSNTQRYKMLGNGWTVDVIAHILKGIEPLY